MKEPILGYATNCYAGESAAELVAAVRTEVAAVRKHLPAGEPLNLSLRISAQAAREFGAAPHLLEELRAALGAAGARIVGANAFPISAPRRPDGGGGGRGTGGGQEGHSRPPPPVPRPLVYKDGIYSPDWTSPQRLVATGQIARAAAALVPEGVRAVLTTLTGTYRGWGCASCSDEAEADCARNLLACAGELEAVSRETGRELVLALEPEPFTTADSLDGTIRYFKERLFRGPKEDVARRRLAVNLDLCHAAVMFEDAAENLRAYAREGIPVAGLHVSAALRLSEPGANSDGLAALKSFDEPVYLHQACAVDRSGRVVFSSADLGEFLALPGERLRTFAEVRVHFHAPIFSAGLGESGLGAGGLGLGSEKGGAASCPSPETQDPRPETLPLGTTSDLIAPAIREALSGGHTDLFVVETYTWKLLEGTPGAAATTAEGIARELRVARQWLDPVRGA